MLLKKVEITLKTVVKKTKITIKAIFTKVKNAYFKNNYKVKRKFNNKIVARKFFTTVNPIYNSHLIL